MRHAYLLALPMIAACSAPMPANDAAIGGDSGGATDGGSTTCMSVPPTCVDQQIMDLDLFTTVNMAAITEEGTTPGTFLTHVDASAGGLMPTDSYIYVRFTSAGLTRVAISDQDAFASTDWDIALRRFVIRLNSGVSGPSCVQAAHLLPDPATHMPPTFDSITSVPAGLMYNAENYMTPTSCTLITDGSPASGPATVLDSYFNYYQSLMCLQMTHNVYVIQLANGRHVKLQVASYYEPVSHQMLCDTMQSIPMPYGSGNLRLQWSFLD